jgi:hypothetical protein
MHKMFRFADGPWLSDGDSIRFMYAVNDYASKRGKKIFDAPVSDVGSRRWCGEQRYVEEYKEAWVVGPLELTPDGWRIIARTKRAALHMRKAAVRLGIMPAKEATK